MVTISTADYWYYLQMFTSFSFVVCHVHTLIRSDYRICPLGGVLSVRKLQRSLISENDDDIYVETVVL